MNCFFCTINSISRCFSAVFLSQLFDVSSIDFGSNGAKWTDVLLCMEQIMNILVSLKSPQWWIFDIISVEQNEGKTHYE